jgi:hypothetical protein
MSHAFFFDSWQNLMDPLVEPRGKLSLGYDNVNASERRQTGQQVEVRRPETLAVCGSIAHRDNDSQVRPPHRMLEEPTAKRVFVEATQLKQSRLVSAERPDKKMRLLQQSCGPAIDF